jgi:hypothetical protein
MLTREGDQKHVTKRDQIDIREGVVQTPQV